MTFMNPELQVKTMNLDEHFCSYEKFAKKMFGASSYQAKKSYLEWLSEHGRSVIAMNKCGNMVVGCGHTWVESWDVFGDIEPVDVGHNLMVLPDFRNGVGAELVLAVFNKSRCYFILGVAGKLAQAYARLGMVPICTFHYRKIFRPVIGAIKFIGSRLFNIEFGDRFFIFPASFNGVYFVLSPAPGLINDLVKIANSNSSGVISQHWDVDFFRWRFFHSKGPRHLLIYLGAKNKPTDFLVLSLGRCKGLSTMRIILSVAHSADSLRQLMSAAKVVAKNSKVDVLLSMHADQELAKFYAAIGWKPIKNPSAATYVYLPRRKHENCKFSFSAAAGDCGLESIK
jgi:hypothetical protein